MSFLVGFGLGFLTGWIVLKRPQWATDGLAWIKAKLRARFGRSP